MKKLLTIFIAISMIFASLAFAGCSSKDSNQKEESQTPDAETEIEKNREEPVNLEADISLEEAKEIALEYANLTDKDVQFINAHLDNDDGKLEYDIEFVYQGTEYEFEIDANTGKVTSYETEMHD